MSGIRAQLAIALCAGGFGALVAIAVANPRRASAEATPQPVRWQQWCTSANVYPVEQINDSLRHGGLTGWELAGVSVEERAQKVDYCYKRPWVGSLPLQVEHATEPSPPPLPGPPTERDLVASLGSEHTVLAACRSTYARSTTQVPIAVTVNPMGQVMNVSLSGVDASGPFGNCLERALGHLSLAPFKGGPVVLKTTLTLP